MEKSGEVMMKVRKGAWTKEEDILLTKCIHDFGEGKWHLVPPRAGLNRCRKSCRMRWLNYLKPNVKRGYFDPAEVDLIQRLHKLLGNRWSLIAGRIPGRTANDVKNFWNTHISKKQQPPSKMNAAPVTTNIIKPRPRNLTKMLLSQSQQQPPQLLDNANTTTATAAAAAVQTKNINPSSSSTTLPSSSPILMVQEAEAGGEEAGSGPGRWWEQLLQMSTENGEDDVGPLSCLENDKQVQSGMDGLMSDLLLDFHVWENNTPM